MRADSGLIDRIAFTPSSKIQPNAFTVLTHKNETVSVDDQTLHEIITNAVAIETAVNLRFNE